MWAFTGAIFDFAMDLFFLLCSFGLAAVMVGLTIAIVIYAVRLARFGIKELKTRWKASKERN